MTSSTDTGPMAAPTAPSTPPADLRATMAGPAGYIACATHLGRRRRSNNDHVTVRVGPNYTALVVADGLGAAQDAGLAARIAAEVAATVAAQTGMARVACEAARVAVLGNFDDDPSSATSTLTVAILSNHSGRQDGAASWIDLAWLGDSNAWLLLADGFMLMERLTTPHNLEDDPHVVTRTVTYGEPGHELIELNDPPGWRLLVCSDGLDGYVDHEVIEQILTGAESAHEACDALLAAALEAGGRDNVTVIVAELGGERKRKPGRGVVAACPSCGQADPPVTTLGDAEGTVETDCCRADVANVEPAAE